MSALDGFFAKRPTEPFREWIHSERTWWIAVPPAEQANLGGRLKPGLITGLAMVCGGALATLVTMKAMNLPFTHPAAAAAFAVFILGFVVAFASSRVVEPGAWRAIAQRPGRLFTPDARAAFVSVEAAETFHKLKTIGDEVGFVRATEHGLLLELERWRATLHRADIAAQLITRDGKAFSVCLRCGREARTFSFVLSLVHTPKGCPFWLMLASRGKARWLIKWLGLQERGVA